MTKMDTYYNRKMEFKSESEKSLNETDMKNNN